MTAVSLRPVVPTASGHDDDSPEAHLSLGRESRPEATVITLTGEVSAYTTPLLREELEPLQAVPVIIDLREVDHLDASGLGFMVGATERRRQRGSDTVLVVEGGLAELFGYTRLCREAVLWSTTQEALASMSR